MLKTLIIVFSCFLAFANAQDKPAVKTLLPLSLKEVSGLWIEDPDNYWWLNDSGNPPALYRTGADGRLKDSVLLPLRNKDWEEITGDRQGNLYIGDFGNNKNARQDLRIYKYQPLTGKIDSILFKFSDQSAFPPAGVSEWHFDCEAMVVWRDTIHIFAKDAFAGPGICKHYILPAQPGNYTAFLQEEILLKKSAVTGAALDPAGERLVLVSYHFSKFLGKYILGRADIHVFTDFGAGLFFNGARYRKKAPYCLLPRQYESIAFYNDAWLITAAEGVYFQRQQFRRKKISISSKTAHLDN